MVGFDTLISSLNSILTEAKIYDTGYIALISPDGTIAYHPNTDFNGSSIYDSLPPNVAEAADEVYKNGTSVNITAVATMTGKKSLTV